MPIKKSGKKWEVDGQEFDTEAAAENAYKAKIALAFGVSPPEVDKPNRGKSSKKKSTKKAKVEDDAEDEENE